MEDVAMRDIYIFPFDKVNKGENIIIYGAGHMGQCYLEQIRKLQYCNIISVVDKDYKKYQQLNCEVISPEDIRNNYYDKIVIAIKNRNAVKEVYEYLLDKCSVDENRIVKSDIKTFELKYMKKNTAVYRGGAAYNEEGVSIAMYLPGGMGDSIIGKRFLKALIDEVDEGCRCNVDLYASNKAVEGCLPAIFGNDEYVNSIYAGSPDSIELAKYDVVLELSLGYTLHILEINERIRTKGAVHFYEMVNRVKKKEDEYGYSTKFTDNAVHFRRCDFLNYNCYTFYQYYGFDVSDWKCDIYINKSVGNAYLDRINLNRNDKYITINCSWGGYSDGNEKRISSKMWNPIYYKEFVCRIHKIFPQIKIVQLGVGECPRIPYVDIYAFDLSIESVKHILFYSLVHVDCEGGLVHLATQLGTKCVVLFGSTPIHYFGYKENINIVSNRCKGCYCLYNDIAGCARGLKEPECMNDIKPEIVVDKVVEYINDLNI